MPTVYVADRISDNIARTPEGFLLCRDVVIARTATRVPQRYRGEELGLEGSREMYDVWRLPSEVFAPRALHSGEGKPITSPHPPEFLGPSNTNWYQKGHIQNIRRGGELEDGEEALIADLIITDAALIEQVEGGFLRDVSLGYKCVYVQRDDGTIEQTQLLVNHAAIVEKGRAGSEVSIADAAAEETMDKDLKKELGRAIALVEEVLQKRPGSRTIPNGQSDAYQAYDAQMKAGQEFSDVAKRVGQEMGKKSLESATRKS